MRATRPNPSGSGTVAEPSRRDTPLTQNPGQDLSGCLDQLSAVGLPVREECHTLERTNPDKEA